MLWKRLVKEGGTCPRCGSTQENVAGAVEKLEAALRPLGIEPVLETLAIDESTFQANPSESNRIWIAGKPLEGCCAPARSSASRSDAAQIWASAQASAISASVLPRS
jgi:hypothetical protein